MTAGTCWAFPATDLSCPWRATCCCVACWPVRSPVLLAFGVAAVFGEPQLELASGFYILMTHAAGQRWNRTWSAAWMQRSLGLADWRASPSGWRLAVFWRWHSPSPGNASGRSASTTLAVLLAGAGFVVVGAGAATEISSHIRRRSAAEETIGLRTALYFEMILIAARRPGAGRTLLGSRLIARLGGTEGVPDRRADFCPASWVRLQIALPNIGRGARRLPGRRAVAFPTPPRLPRRSRCGSVWAGFLRRWRDDRCRSDEAPQPSLWFINSTVSFDAACISPSRDLTSAIRVARRNGLTSIVV